MAAELGHMFTYVELLNLEATIVDITSENIFRGEKHLKSLRDDFIFLVHIQHNAVAYTTANYSFFFLKRPNGTSTRYKCMCTYE